MSKLARHSSYSITADIYGHLTKTMQDRAAEKMGTILKRRITDNPSTAAALQQNP